jgi:hypothetical protein
VTCTVRAGQETSDPIEAVTGCAGGDADVPDGFGAGEVSDPEGLGLPDVVAEVDALDSPDVLLMMAGTAISAAMTANTAAMTTRGNCIAVLLGRPAYAKRVAGDARSFLT